MKSEWSRTSILATATSVVFALSACASGTGSAANSAHPSATPLSQVAREAAHPDPNFDYGFTIQIAHDGFHPAWLVANCCQPITWRNLTASPVSVVFDAEQVDSGPIQPGQTFVFTPHQIQSIAYHAGNNPAMTGAVQVNQTWEDPTLSPSPAP